MPADSTAHEIQSHVRTGTGQHLHFAGIRKAFIAGAFVACFAGCGENGRYVLQADGQVKIDTRTGKTWVIRNDKDTGYKPAWQQISEWKE